MIENSADKLEYYYNGELIDYGYVGHVAYTQGLEVWNTDDNYFFIGVCCYGSDTSNYYFNGDVYTTRLYTTSMTPNQVKENYDTTLKYRSSF